MESSPEIELRLESEGRGARASLPSQDAIASSIFSAMYQLLLVVFNADEARIDCLSTSVVWTSAPMVMLIYMLVSIILLMNMLIALTAKTFSDNWENQKEIYSFMFAQQAHVLVGWARLRGKEASAPPRMRAS